MVDEEKIIDRTEHLLFYLCGCSKEEAVIILKKLLKKLEVKKE